METTLFKPLPTTIPPPPPLAEAFPVSEDEALLRRVDEGFADLERTGLHITIEEFQAWVAAIKVDPNAPEPVCHL